MIFEYAYGKRLIPFKKVLNSIIIGIDDIGTSLFIVACSFFLDYVLTMKIETYTIRHILFWVFVVLNIIQFFFFLKEFLTKKNCVTNDKGIVIKRGSWFPGYGFNDYILYSDIVSCELYPTKFHPLMDGNCYATIFCDFQKMVKITDIKKHEYYVPLVECEKFVALVNERIASNNDSEA